jgi:hypothetical protein
MHWKIYPGLAVIVFLVAPIWQEKKASEHEITDKCPAECPVCTEAVKHALDFLKKTQKKDGHWDCGSYGKSVQAQAASLCGLAFLAEGSTTKNGTYSEPLKKCYQFISKWVSSGANDGGDVGNDPRFGNRNLWALAPCLLFLSELYRIEKEESALKSIKKLFKYIENTVADDGHFRQGFAAMAMGRVTSNSGIAPTNWAIFALLLAQRNGIEGVKVKEKMLEKAWKYYTKSTDKKEGLIYGLDRDDTDRRNDSLPKSRGRVSRNAGAVISLNFMGKQEEELYKKIVKFVKEHWEDLTFLYVPNISVFVGGVAAQLLGKEEWEKFKKIYINKLLKLQRKDGSFSYLAKESPYDHYDNIGKGYNTAIFALTMQLPKKHVNFLPEPKK